MKPILWVGLVLVAGASAYLSQQEPTDVDVVARADRAGDSKPTGPSGSPSAQGTSRRATAVAAAPGVTPQAAQQLAQQRQALVVAVAAWQPRTQGQADSARRLDQTGQAAWASQQPPPPPPAMAPPPPPPEAPAFTHAWVGRYVDTQPKAILAGPTRTWVVQVGDVIEGQWRIESIQERQMQVIYLPMQQRLTVMMK